MSRALFVSNGHGEIAIAARIAGEIRGIACDHLALVGGEHAVGGALHDVGPRKGMPSGGLIAMASYFRWEVNERAMRLGRPLGYSPLVRLLAVGVAVLAVIWALRVLL